MVARPADTSSSEAIIVSVMKDIVARIGRGFDKEIYETAFKNKMESLGSFVQMKPQISIVHEGQNVGYVQPDMIVSIKTDNDDLQDVIVGIKTDDGINEKQRAQIKGAIKFSRIPVGILLNVDHDKGFTHEMIVENLSMV